jgi:hypothetical protein
MLGYFCRCNFCIDLSVNDAEWYTAQHHDLWQQNSLRRLYVWCYAPRCHMKRCGFLSDNKRPSYLDLRRGLCDSVESVRCSGIKVKPAVFLSWREERLYIEYNHCNNNAILSLKQHVSTKQVIFRLFPWRIWFSCIVCSIYAVDFSLM